MWGLVLYFHPLGSGDGIKVVKLGSTLWNQEFPWFCTLTTHPKGLLLDYSEMIWLDQKSSAMFCGVWRKHLDPISVTCFFVDLLFLPLLEVVIN